VAEFPSAEQPAALRLLSAQAQLALPARRDRADQNALTHMIALNAGTEFMDYSDRLVTDRQSRRHRVLAAHDVQVGAANRGQCHAYDRLPRSRLRVRLFFESKLARRAEDIRLHERALDRTRSMLFDCKRHHQL